MFTFINLNFYKRKLYKTYYTFSQKRSFYNRGVYHYARNTVVCDFTGSQVFYQFN